MSDLTKARLWVALAFFLALAWFWWSVGVARADDCRGNSCNGGPDTVNVGDTTVTTGDVSTALSAQGNNSHYESKSLALGNVLGDVDIADCLGSTQWSTPLYGRQGLTLNNVCMAEFYLSAGKYRLAAMALCNIKEILREFENEEACEEAHDFTPSDPVASAVANVTRAYEQELEQLRWEQATMQAQITEQQALLEQAPQRPVVVQQEFVSEEKRAAIKALFTDDAGEERE